MAKRIVPLIMCGGAGTRLWPASRESRPKQFLSLFGDRSTFQDTLARVGDSALFDEYEGTDAASVAAAREAVMKAGNDLGFVTLQEDAFARATPMSIDYA